MTQYVNGFMMDPVREQVLFIRKNRPTFQAGKWNGIGGKIEYGETPIEAMVREFREETGVLTLKNSWEPTIVLTGANFIVHFYRSFVEKMPAYRTMTDEEVRVQAIDDALTPYSLAVHRDGSVTKDYLLPTLPNMRWILPLSMNINVHFPVHVEWKESH